MTTPYSCSRCVGHALHVAEWGLATGDALPYTAMLPGGWPPINGRVVVFLLQAAQRLYACSADLVAMRKLEMGQRSSAAARLPSSVPALVRHSTCSNAPSVPAPQWYWFREHLYYLQKIQVRRGWHLGGARKHKDSHVASAPLCAPTALAYPRGALRGPMHCLHSKARLCGGAVKLRYNTGGPYSPHSDPDPRPSPAAATYVQLWVSAVPKCGCWRRAMLTCP